MIQLKQPTLDHFFRTLNILDVTVSPDEKQIVYTTNINGYYNLWALDVGKRYPYQLTTKNQMASFIKFDPQQRYVFTGFDEDGDENYHIYALSPNGGELTTLLSAKDEKFFYGDLSNDGKTLYYSTSVDNRNYLNLCSYDIETGDQRILVKGEEGPVSFASISPDQRTFTYIHSFGNTRVFAYAQTIGESTEGSSPVLLAPNDEPHRVFDVLYQDETTVLLVTNHGQEFAYVAKYDLQTNTFEKLIDIEGFECEQIEYDRQNDVLYIIASRGVEDDLYRFDMSSHNLTKMSKPTDLVNKLIVGEKGTLFVLGRSATKPANVFMSRDAKTWEALTDHRVIGVHESQLSEPEVLTYASYDGTSIEALYFKPSPEKDNGHTVLWPHGGPQAAERKSFRALFQYLCYQGYRVFAPNFRGSTGYGETFTNMVNKDWGGGPRLDIVEGMKWLNEKGLAEEGKWFCVGGSYGGYMTLLLHGRHADLFKAFVDIFGPSNLFTTIETAPEDWKAADRELIGDPEEDKEKLIEDSPMTYKDDMNKPMLVIQGAKDPRVVKVESDVIVEALKERGQDVEYIVLDDEGHGFSKTENALMVYERLVSFLNKYLDK